MMSNGFVKLKKRQLPKSVSEWYRVNVFDVLDKKMEVTIQPKAYAPKDFQTSLLSCCDDIGVCK